MDADGVRTRSPSAAAAAMESVLGDDDLLREILRRLHGSPASLVRAALVCKRWLSHVSDPAFLRRFQERHPPRLLGFYLESACKAFQQFVPLPDLPPELAAVARTASFDLTAEFYMHTSIEHCRNGVLLLRHTGYDKFIYQVRSPLNLARDGAVVATCCKSMADEERHYGYMLLPNDGGHGMSVNFVGSHLELFAKVRSFQDGVCHDLRTSASIELPAHWKVSLHNRSLLHNGKLYMLGTTGYILGLELASTRLFFIELPDAIRYEPPGSLQLSLKMSHQTVNSGVYLLNLEGLKINVWLRSTDDNSSWLLVDTICLRQVFGHLVKPSWESGASRINLAGSGDNAEFVFLEVDAEIFCMYIRSRTVVKVYEMEYKDDQLFQIYPFMMVWPPIFPALIQRRDQVEISES